MVFASERKKFILRKFILVSVREEVIMGNYDFGLQKDERKI